MTSDIYEKHGGPAFPFTIDDGPTETYFGMSLRDYFAAAALTWMLSNDSTQAVDVDAKIAYRLADAMIAERSKTEGTP